jgi:Kef-type K+ transport system membrane component KefB
VTLVALAAHLPLLLAQMAVILGVTTLFGFLAARLRQPSVIGNIFGGLLLGPVALGHLFPATHAWLFPADHLDTLTFISNVGLVAFLFLIGAELDIDTVRRNPRGTVAITLGNIGLPFAFGALLSPALLARFSTARVPHGAFVVFIGVAMSITALPVLARIVQERKDDHHPVDPAIAATAIVCAAANDLVAWTLALSLTIAHTERLGHNLATTSIHVFILFVYIAFMLQVVRPFAKKILIFSKHRPRTWLWLPCALLLAAASALFTLNLGMHLFFGAFLAGVCIPVTHKRGVALDRALQNTLRPIIAFTLPVFFALTGLSMKAGSFNAQTFRWFVIITLLAVAGKIGGGMISARLIGMAWKPATQIGILLNTRGLVELIVLNIGLHEGVLTPALFTIFVLMALTTTVMTAPLLDLSQQLMKPAA